MNLREMYVEVNGKSYKIKSKNLRAVLRRAMDLPDVAEPVDRKLYLVVTGEDGEAGTGGFVHLATRDFKKATARLKKVVRNLGFDWLKRGTNDGDDDADERFDFDGTHAHVNTFGNGVSFEATVKEIRDSDFDKGDYCV